jgi:hypothetical protein
VSRSRDGREAKVAAGAAAITGFLCWLVNKLVDVTVLVREAVAVP